MRRIMSKYSEQFEKLKEHNLKVIEEHYGKRCKVKDTDDFPELLEPPFANNDPDYSRCGVCLVYEKFDAYWKALYDDDSVEVS